MTNDTYTPYPGCSGAVQTRKSRGKRSAIVSLPDESEGRGTASREPGDGQEDQHPSTPQSPRMPAPAPVPIPAARTAKFELVKSKQLAFALPWDNACSALFSRAEDSFRVKQLARLYCTNTFDWDERWLDRYRPQKTEDYINNMEKIARDRGGFAIMVKLERPRSLENEHVI